MFFFFERQWGPKLMQTPWAKHCVDKSSYLFCVPQKKVSYTGFEQHEGVNDDSIFIFNDLFLLETTITECSNSKSLT